MEGAGATGTRATITDSPEGLEIVLPAPRIWLVVGFLLLWLAGWVTGEIFAVRQLLAPGPIQARLFLVAWLALWTLGGGTALSIAVWMLVGHERVRLRPDALTIQREAFGLGPKRVYALDHIRDLRALDPPPLPDLKLPAGAEALEGVPQEAAIVAMHAAGIGGPGIVFRYDGRHVRFGVALDPLEAHQVVAQLQGRHAFPGGRSAA
jgi:hypothetical protein